MILTRDVSAKMGIFQIQIMKINANNALIYAKYVKVQINAQSANIQV